jgi:CheY-like chemotaxis protein
MFIPDKEQERARRAMPLVLVVEDDADIRLVMLEALHSAGYEAEAVAGGVHALERLRAGTQPQLILLDSNMAGMSGAAFREAQLQDPALAAIPVLLLSGGENLSDQAQAMRVNFLHKPFRLAELMSAVQQVCGPPR